MNRPLATICLSLTAALLPAGAQASSPATPPGIFSPVTQGALERARLMTAQGNFTGALDQLRSIDTAALGAEEAEEREWLVCRALYGRGDAGCIAVLEDFISRHPASAEALTARLMAADYYFFARQYGPALQRYLEIGTDALSGSQRELYTYRRAICELRTGHYDSARADLAQLRASQRYATAALFYDAYIDYAEGHLDEAEKGFQTVARRPAPQGDADGEYLPGGLDARAYLVQIDFARGDWRRTVSQGEALLDAKALPEELRDETQRVVGESLFKLGINDKARRTLASYAASADTPASSAMYALGVLEYDRGDYARAEEIFASLTPLRDDLAQSASLYLGQIAVARGEEDMAAICFRKAWEMGFDPKVTETALYNYVAATTRGGSIPFASSIPMLEQFMERFAHSEYAPAVEEYLAAAYYNEKDYTRALESIAAIPNPGPKVRAAKQKIEYEAGIEALSNGDAHRAAALFRSASAASAPDRAVATQASLWLGDALFAADDWNGAETAYRRYIAATRPSANRTLALYDLAYTLYMKDSFATAAATFAEALAARPELPAPLSADARLRRADCLYYSGSYDEALRLYAEAARGSRDADYASLRHATLLGLRGDMNGKLRELTDLPKQYPGSRWASAALLEKGGTLAALGRTAEAEETFRQLAATDPKAPEARQGALQLAMTYNRQGDRTAAAEAYRDVISRWPTSEEARLANEDLRRIAAAEGKVEEYAAFLRSVPGAPALDADEMERLVFDAAETALADNEEDTTLLEQYVSRYPDGRYLAQALLDLADVRAAAGQDDAALDAATRLLRLRPDSPQAPEALLIAAEILEEQPARRAEALDAYRRLSRIGGNTYAAEAAAGIMRTTDDPQERISSARIVSRAAGLSQEQTDEAAYYEASGLERRGDTAEAEKIYRRLAANPKSLPGAMANVALGEMLLAAGRADEAEKSLAQFIDRGTPHQYWLARGFITLSDAYHRLGRPAVAREYILSLRDNYPGTELDIHDMINQRLDRK